MPVLPAGRGDNVAAAYPQGNGSFGVRAQRLLVSVAGSVFLFIMLRNVLFKDYKADTIDYLKSTGREAEIDRIIPKTAAEKQKAARAASMTLVQKLDILTKTVAQLQTEVEYLQYTVGNLTGEPVPRGPPQPVNASLPAEPQQQQQQAEEEGKT